jgi:hypothetical protein
MMDPYFLALEEAFSLDFMLGSEYTDNDRQDM